MDQGPNGPTGPSGCQGPTGPTGSIGVQGLLVLGRGTKRTRNTSSDSIAFRACLDITTEAEDIQGNNSINGEITISLPSNSTTPTDYTDIIYDKTAYNDSNFFAIQLQVKLL